MTKQNALIAHLVKLSPQLLISAWTAVPENSIPMAKLASRVMVIEKTPQHVPNAKLAKGRKQVTIHAKLAPQAHGMSMVKHAYRVKAR